MITEVPDPPGDILTCIPDPPAAPYSIQLPEEAMDIECYRNYFLIKFRTIDEGLTSQFQLYGENDYFEDLTVVEIKRHIAKCTLITFNGLKYDIPMLSAALLGHSCNSLKMLSDAIIKRNLQPWMFSQEFNVPLHQCDHIDLIEIAPGISSLKEYGGRLHSQKLQDLPIHEASLIARDQLALMDAYCGNDLIITVDLRNKLRQQIDLRKKLSDEYGIDLRSKSDAQIAEAVIKKQLGFYVEKVSYPPGTRFYYKVPSFIQFQTPLLQATLEMVRLSPFTISPKEVLEMSNEMESAKIKIGNSFYQMGMGGLHSCEKCVCHVADSYYELSDLDVASFYPKIILNQGLYPPQMGPKFLEIFRGMTERRIEAKRSGRKADADSEKIMINGTFGKLGSKYSILFSPDLLIQTTVTGQLVILMLIEMLELNNVPVVSSNTDGLVIKCPRHLTWLRDDIVKWWEQQTNFEMEVTPYLKIASRDVNNYVAIKTDGKHKVKGAYAEEGGKGSVLDKNPTNLVCSDAVVEYLKNGTPVETTIYFCDDVRRFVRTQKVTGGAEKNGQYLGKAIRWYYAKGEYGDIKYVTNGNRVARTEGAKPLMDLTPHVPFDIDYEWYVREAKSMLVDVGVTLSS